MNVDILEASAKIHVRGKQHDNTTRSLSHYPSFCKNKIRIVMTPEQVLERYYYQGWNKADTSILKELVDENVKFRAVFSRRPKRGIDTLLSYFDSTRQALSKYTFEIEEMIVSKDGTKASVRVSCRGMHTGNFFGMKGSGHEIHFEAAAFFHFSPTSGCITDINVIGDLDSIKRQIGIDSAEAAPFET